jgi:hypothetical protein
MDTPAADLDSWTTDELLAEVLSRSSGDRSALDRIRVSTMRALLDDCDQKSRTERQAV